MPKIEELTELAETPAATDQLPVVDLSATETVRTKRIQFSNLSSFTGTGTGSVQRTIAGKLQEFISVTDHDADLALGATSAITAFQAAVDAVIDGHPGVIFVPAGTYAGDLTTLTYGTRSIVFVELGDVTYSDGAPKACRVFSKYAGDKTRPWFVGEFGFAHSTASDYDSTDRPVIRVYRNSNHTGSRGSNPAAVEFALRVSDGVTDKQNALVVETDIYATTQGDSTTCAQFEARKKVAGTSNLIAHNIVAKDESGEKSSVSLGSLVGCEIDVVASGDDDNTTRIALDLIGRAYDAASQVYTLIYARSANSSVSGSYGCEVQNVLLAKPGSKGSIGCVINAQDITGDLFTLTKSSAVVGRMSTTGLLKHYGNQYNASQFDKTNNTSAYVTGLNTSVEAGKKYKFRAMLFITAGATGGWKAAVSGTCTATAVVYTVVGTNPASGAILAQGRKTALNDPVGEAGGTTSVDCVIEGSIDVANAGTFRPVFAQYTTDAGTSSVLVGSTWHIEECN